MSVRAGRRLSEQCDDLLSHRSNRFTAGHGVMRGFVGPQLRHPNRVRLFERRDDAIGNKSTRITPSAHALDSRLPRDLEQVVAWVRGGKEPTSVALASFPAARLNTMSTRNSAAYKGLYALLMKQGCTDWTYTKEPINADIFADQQVDLALIFPKQWCDKNGIPRERRDSIVNKTPLTNRTRRIVANLPPDIYMEKLEAEAGLPGNWLDDIIGTHLIDARYLRGTNGREGPLRTIRKPATLNAEDFDAFYESRSARLIELIEDAIGRRAVPQEAAPESAADYQQDQSA